MTAIQSVRAELALKNLPDLWVAIRPREAFAVLRDQSQSVSGWQSIQRPLLISLVLSCAMRLLASAPLSIWLVLSTALYWSIVPLAGFAGLYFLIGNQQRDAGRARWVDLFFTGYASWLLWWLSLCLVCSLLSPIDAESLVFVYTEWVVAGTAIVILWSAYIDYCFFRVALSRTRGRACRDLAIQRLISWSIMIAVYAFGAFFSEIATAVGQ